MRKNPRIEAECGRITQGPMASAKSDGGNGAFAVRHPVSNRQLKVIASTGEGWDHVSVSCARSAPTWNEMCYVKELFFHPTETAVQYHPKESEYVNCHPHCLHLWRNQDREHSLPPSILIGPVTGKAAT